MIRIFFGACALALSTLTAMASDADLDARQLPMQFELRRERPAQVCGKECRTWVSASGAITSDTARDFEAFARGHELRGAVIALDSDGGSVVGALALGRAIRKLGMSTTVGQTVELPMGDGKEKIYALQPRAYCGSMCTFVLLAGIERHVPPEAHVLVHQIWLGDRRDDPTAATYSAEDLVLVQRDIGQIASYTIEMAGSIDLLSIMLKIPPWEPMYELTRSQLRDMKLVSVDDRAAVRKISTLRYISPVSNGSRNAGGAQAWTATEKDGPLTLFRRHPLTVYGETIGNFELKLHCGTTADSYVLTYTETRSASTKRRALESLRDVELTFGGKVVSLKVESSQLISQAAGRESRASGMVPAALIKRLAAPGKQSLTVETYSLDDTATIITIGNAGLTRNFSQLISSCAARSQLRNAAAQNPTATAAVVSPAATGSTPAADR